ncbi:hypothetical protein EDB85DRAFT_1886021 [Lactarius pseudohatsudake]|nr:hypothetical protein EDB85DRAFT_1886021 [Lactarius pseudohatsudake]
MHNGVTGYFVDIPTRPSRYYPVEFNFKHICWAEVAWNPPLQRWDINRPAGSEFHCDIDRREIPSRKNWGQLDGQDTPSSQAAVPEDTSESESGMDTGDNESEEDHLSNVNPEEQEELTRLAAATEAVRMEEQPLLPINPHTGHREGQPPPHPQMERSAYINPYTGERYTEEDLALHRAVGPDRDDPPSGGRQRRGWPPDDGLPGGGGGPPRGSGGGGFGEGFGGGGPPGGFGGGPPGGWPPVGGPPAGPVAPPPGGNSKFVGQPPEVFTGDCTKTEEFLTQWELYWGVNNNNTVMSNPYQRAMIFLTYIRGVGVNEWLVAISRWLN